MKHKLTIALLVIIITVPTSIYLTRKIKRSFQIDACLDKGCSWNYILEKCDCLDFWTNPTKFYWYSDYDPIKNKEFLVKGDSMNLIKLSPYQLVEILNTRKPECKIELIGITKDTIKIKIINDEYLSERMGSTGAFCYLGETVFTLTENDSINYVNIDMDYGSHASPGVYSRNDFKGLADY